MLLSNVTLQERIATTDEMYEHMWNTYYHPILIRGMQPRAIQPCSVDFYVSDDPPLMLLYSTQYKFNTPEYFMYTELIQEEDEHGTFYWLLPNRIYLMKSHEYFRIPIDICGQVRGVSTNGRMGFVPHKEAGLLDPGWEGHITLEVEVTEAGRLYPVYDGKRFRVAQVVFESLDHPADPPYKGRYQADKTAQPPKANF